MNYDYSLCVTSHISFAKVTVKLISKNTGCHRHGIYSTQLIQIDKEVEDRWWRARQHEVTAMALIIHNSKSLYNTNKWFI